MLLNMERNRGVTMNTITMSKPGRIKKEIHRDRFSVR